MMCPRSEPERTSVKDNVEIHFTVVGMNVKLCSICDVNAPFACFLW